ncbi:hypothetical protein [Pseudomonas lini]|uniref:Uncharacterized protein n=1 Tax=Pseudomonas lini TaxID=163011 RepID=A0A0J6H8W8_9PSED|nr:hypothetical protein [Pseudomonas lini]KAB0498261.1 hypothetical protein F7R14_27365 [Pseudomonas lini]KMM93466.1 hypothetical protein TU81_11795 [Pseudomonas lini]SDT55043.1 hypothetical protein SAMN04490191_5122 [Pseudomonas lini]
MSYINLPSDQQAAISDVDETVLRAAVHKCLDEERVGPIHGLDLSNCGPYVATKLHGFQQAIAEYSKAKAHAKRERTRQDALRAGSDLVHAVQQMKGRLKTERQEGELFYIDDQIRPPFHLSKRLSVRVPFRWRASQSADWDHGQLTFVYDFSPQPNYTQLPPKRKPSAAKVARDLEDRLFEEWERLKMQALFSLREFFRKGGDGDAVPEVFSVRPSPHGGGLNNFSCNFWQPERPAP